MHSHSSVYVLQSDAAISIPVLIVTHHSPVVTAVSSILPSKGTDLLVVGEWGLEVVTVQAFVCL